MKKDPPSFARPGTSRAEGGSALIIVLSFVVLLTVVVLAMLSHSLLNRSISNASSNVTKTDLYAHGAIDQIIGDLEQEIVAGSSGSDNGVANTQSTTGGNIYRPSSVAASVPYNSGPSTYAAAAAAGITTVAATTVWNTMPNLVKESTHGVSFEPYDSPTPRAAPVSTTSLSVDGSSRIISGSADGTSLNGHYVSVIRWNKPLLLPKASAFSNMTTTSSAGTVISSDSSTATTPLSSFVAPDWILTAANGTNPVAWPSSPATTIENPKSTSYVVGRYAYTIYNEGGLLDANVAGCPSSTTAGGWTTTGVASDATILSRKGPSAFADLTQLPGLADITKLEVEGSSRGQHIVDSLLGWRNAASAASNPSGLASPFPTYKFSNSTDVNIGNYFNYLLGLSSNFMSTGYTSAYYSTGTYTSPGYQDPYTGQVVTDQVFTGRQQMINFFEYVVPTTSATYRTTEQAYLQDAMMYLGTFSRTLNQPSYWPDPARPKETGVWPGSPVNFTLNTYNGWNDAPGSTTADNEDAYNPAMRAARVVTGHTFNRPDGISTLDGTPAAVGDPLIKKRFPLCRLMWLTYKGPSALVATTDPLFLAYQQFYTGSTSGTAPAWLTQLWNEGTAANIKAYFGLTWGADPLNATSYIQLSERAGNCWTYLHGVATANNTEIGALTDVQGQNREPDFFELLQAAVKIGGISMVGDYTANGEHTGMYSQYRDSQPIFQILQLGANIIDEANPTQFPTHIEFSATITSNNNGTVTTYPNVIESVYGAMDLPYLYEYKNVAFINNPGSAATAPSGTIAGLVVPIIWDPYDLNGPSTATYSVPLSSSLYPSLLRITALSSPLIPLSTSGATPYGAYVWNIKPVDAASDSEPTADVTEPYWATEDQTSLTFNNPTPATSSQSTLYREPVALDQITAPASSGLTNSGLALGTGNLITAAFSSAGIPEKSSGLNFVGFLMGSCYQYWASSNGGPVSSWGALLNPGTTGAGGITIRMEYQSGTNWIPYQEYYLNGDQATLNVPTSEPPNFYSPTGAAGIWNTGTPSWPLRILYDPRTNRWGTPQSISGGGFTDNTGTTVYSTRPTAAAGSSSSTTSISSGYDGINPNPLNPGFLTQNVNNHSLLHCNDPDAVIRRAMSAYVPVSAGTPQTAPTTIGLPLATGNTQSRPIILHRPYRSVAELGYVFSDTPFKNIDFFTPESAYSALLDMFCINEDYRPDALAAGRVDLNTKQSPVIQALLAGAYRDEENPTTANTGQLTTSEAVAISQGLVSRTTVGGTNPSVSLTTPQPLSNIGDLVGRWVPGLVTTPNAYISGSSGINGGGNSAYDGSTCYDGFSADLGSLYSGGAPSSSNFPLNSILQRFRESTMRALSDAGQAGTWNLLIDVVAQSGHYPSSASSLSNFLVEGERRYWVHVAIDRQTGQIIDENIEAVNE